MVPPPIAPATPSLLRRFMKKVQPEPNSGCWLWDGSWNPALGYGAMHTGDRLVAAHRLSIFWFKGLDPREKVVRHLCGVRSCVNPDHLELGTHEENMQDMVAAGRTRAKLTAEQVLELRRRRAEGATVVELATFFGVSEAAAASAARGSSYAHVDGPRTKSKTLPGGSRRTDHDRRAFIRSNVTVSENGCWLWKGKPNSLGYARYGDDLAHRVSYAVFVGPIPEGMQVDHRCHERRCVNPDHLEPVTAEENLERRRLKRGEAHFGASLTDEQVRQIRERFVVGRETAQDIARDLGVGRSAVTSLVRGRRRLEAGGLTLERNLPRWSRRELSDEDARTIRERYAAGGVTARELANEFGVTDGVVESLLNGRTYMTAGGPLLTTAQKKMLRFPADKVRELRELAAASPETTIRALAASFGWSQDTIIKLLRHQKCPDAGGPKVVRDDHRRGRPNKGTRKVDDAAAREIRLRYATGQWTAKALGKEFGITGGAVMYIVHGKTFTTAGGPIVPASKSHAGNKEDHED